MSDDEIVRQLANRLGAISGPIFADYEPWPKWEKIAEECLRQMKWARCECDRVASCHWGGPERPECGDPQDCCVERVRENMKAEPITLAPEDWTP